jgi:hypothetical protein
LKNKFYNHEKDFYLLCRCCYPRKLRRKGGGKIVDNCGSKKNLIGKWTRSAFSFYSGTLPNSFFYTCDTLKSPDFKPFDYLIDAEYNKETHQNDTTNTVIFKRLLNPLLTSVTFADAMTNSGIKATFEFEECKTNFTETLNSQSL